MSKNKGFTLIELVVVMVILGILAAFAIPKFYDFRQDSYRAAANGLAGAIRSVSSISHSAAYTIGQLGATGSVTMGGGPVDTVFGYPAGTEDGIGAAVSWDTNLFTLECLSGACAFISDDGLCSVTYEPGDASNHEFVGVDC